MELVSWFNEYLTIVPTWMLILTGIMLWLVGCVIAINIAFGANSLFMYKQLEYATTPYLAGPLFFIGWFLWPIALPLFYIVFTLCVVYEDIWNTLKQIVVRIGIWIPVIALAALALHLTLTGVANLW